MRFLHFLILLFICHPAFAHKVFWGKKVTMGQGFIRSFAEVSGHGDIHEIGIALSHGALKGLGHSSTEFSLELPGGLNLSPFRHMVVNWEPHGHEPDDIYGKPHFDFHFYFISQPERLAITCSDSDALICTKVINPKFIPAGYVPTPGGVPRMGWHWVDSLSPEFQGKPFTHTYIYGYYNGETIFIEPMVTLEVLKSGKTVVKNVRLPKSFPDTGSYPSQYKISYDKKSGLHKVILRQLHQYQ